MIELRAGAATATIDTERGGRLASLRVRGRELIVGPRNDDDRGLGWGCYLMAPWPGRLAEGRLRFRGVTHQLRRTHGRNAIHGLVWSARWELVRRDAASVELHAVLDRDGWPYGGGVHQTFRLEPDRLAISASVTAGAVAMPAALGWHPWLLRDAFGDAASLELHAPAVLERNAMLPTGREVPVAGRTDLRAGPVLGRRRLDDAFVRTVSPAIVRGPDLELRVEFDPELHTVVVYTPWNAICIEPQSAEPNALGLDDEAARRAGRRDLEPGEALSASMALAWR